MEGPKADRGVESVVSGLAGLEGESGGETPTVYGPQCPRELSITSTSVLNAAVVETFRRLGTDSLVDPDRTIGTIEWTPTGFASLLSFSYGVVTRRINWKGKIFIRSNGRRYESSQQESFAQLRSTGGG